ncbi:hypothetical protein [Sinomonas atrocyanea]
MLERIEHHEHGAAARERGEAVQAGTSRGEPRRRFPGAPRVGAAGGPARFGPAAAPSLSGTMPSWTSRPPSSARSQGVAEAQRTSASGRDAANALARDVVPMPAGPSTTAQGAAPRRASSADSSRARATTSSWGFTILRG